MWNPWTAKYKPTKSNKHLNKDIRSYTQIVKIIGQYALRNWFKSILLKIEQVIINQTSTNQKIIENLQS